MHLVLIAVSFAFLGSVTAIPCSEIGWSDGSEPFDAVTNPPGLDPWDPQGRWQVVKASECWVRFQTMLPGSTDMSTRVTKTQFDATPGQVRSTINNYFGSPGNIQLWLPMHTTSFQYANILPESIGEGFPHVSGQSSIVKSRTIMSIILPSGAKKLTEVAPAGADQGESNENIRRARDTGITGLKGTISTDDYAYTTAAEAQLVLFNIFQEQKEAYLNKRRPNLNFAWLTAEMQDPNECVVIDFRDFVKFIIDIRRQPGR